MCKLVDDHKYKKKGKFTRVCVNCGKEVVDEDALNSLINALEARIAQLEMELRSGDRKKAVDDGSSDINPWIVEPPYKVTYGDTTTLTTTLDVENLGKDLRSYKEEFSNLSNNS